MRTYRGLIEELAPNQVFVFGSNLDGFHGAGSAGYASFGESGNVWREHGYGEKPSGWQGRWNVKGIAEGYQVGCAGRSYAIPTVRRPGKRRSVPLRLIRERIDRLYEFAREHPELEFLVAYSGRGGSLNGYSVLEMARAFSGDVPGNVVFEDRFAGFVDLASWDATAE